MQGVPARIAALLEVAKRHGLKLVEDCCQCIGGLYHGKMVGALGDVGAWSLNYFKVLTCGEGGLVFTNDYETYQPASFASDSALPMWMKDSEGQTDWPTPPFSGNCYRPGGVMSAISGGAMAQYGQLPGRTRRTR